MRLDHLLSKERLPPKGGKGPALPGSGWRGAHWRRHWLVMVGNGRVHLVRIGFPVRAPSSRGGVVGVGGGGVGVVRLAVAVDTLLSPERTTVWFPVLSWVPGMA